MRIILAVVASLNGKITKGADGPAHGWASSEDWERFQQLRDECDAIVLDSKTYKQMHITPEAARLRVVLTRSPEKYAPYAVPGQLEFWAATPLECAAQLQDSGHHTILLAGGGRTSSGFLRDGLVDELYLTYEPVLFGEGKGMVAEEPLDVEAHLQEVTRLNDRGTLLLHYIVDK